MKRIIYLLIVVGLLIGLAGVIGGCAETSRLKLTLNDLYYERHSYHELGITFENLVAKLTLETEGKERIRINKNYLQDADGTVYQAVLLGENGGQKTCLGCDVLHIIYVEPGMKADGCLMVLNDVPREVTGLKLIIETDAGQAVFSLPDADSIKVIQVVGTF